MTSHWDTVHRMRNGHISITYSGFPCDRETVQVGPRSRWADSCTAAVWSTRPRRDSVCSAVRAASGAQQRLNSLLPTDSVEWQAPGIIIEKARTWFS